MAIDNPFETNSNDTEYKLEDLVGENKKFKTVEDLVKGKIQSDDYIEVLKADLAKKEAELTNKMSLEDFYQKIKTNQPDQRTDGQTVTTKPEDSVTTPQDINKTVLDTLNRIESERSIRSNEQRVVQKLQEVWGNDSEKKLKEKAAELSTTVSDLREIARQNPEVFFKLTDLNVSRSAPSGTAVPTSTVNPSLTNDATKRDAKYYRELKRTNPKVYKSLDVQMQLQKDAVALGDAYFN